jgi:DNA-binding transcriptional LysR family regulator
LSQPALSAQIKALEDELGVQLFARGPAGMTLTAAGRRLLPDATRVLEDAAALHGKARGIQGEIASHVRLGTLADPDFIRLAAFLAQATERFPLIELELQHSAAGLQWSAMGADELLARRPRDAAVESIPLREIAYRVAGPAAWREKIVGASWEEIAALPWLMAPPISTHHVLATALFAERGRAPAPLIGADNEPVIRSLVASGLGVALVRDDLAREGEAAGELAVWPQARLATTLQFIHASEKREEPEIRALVGVIGDVWHDTIAPRSAKAPAEPHRRARAR